jgi:hypothetical protein
MYQEETMSLQIKKIGKVPSRFVITRTSRRGHRYYTGDHTSRKTVWSRDWKLATIYADFSLAFHDFADLYTGALPEGRRGHVSIEPQSDEEADWN